MQLGILRVTTLFSRLRQLFQPATATGGDIEACAAEALPVPPSHIGTRRKDCWWEPIYAPALRLDPAPYDWDLNRDSGPNGRFIYGPHIHDACGRGEAFKVLKIRFQNCDLQGDFRNGPFIRFDECDFINCDFAFSHWKDAHFRKCTFRRSSLSLAVFENCEFRDCVWEEIGVASKTEFLRTFLNNPASFIGATVSKTDPGNRTIEHRMRQWYRLKGSRAHLLRSIMLSHQHVGDEHTFYETVKMHELTRSIARVCEDIFELIFVKRARVSAVLRLPFHVVDHCILRAFGWLNDWGASAVKPFVALMACNALFGAIYKYVEFSSEIKHPWQKSFDLTLLIGYGNQVSQNDYRLAFVQDCHAVVSIVIYTVFFATIVSKLSRAR